MPKPSVSDILPLTIVRLRREVQDELGAGTREGAHHAAYASTCPTYRAHVGRRDWHRPDRKLPDGGRARGASEHQTTALSGGYEATGGLGQGRSRGPVAQLPLQHRSALHP